MEPLQGDSSRGDGMTIMSKLEWLRRLDARGVLLAVGAVILIRIVVKFLSKSKKRMPGPFFHMPVLGNLSLVGPLPHQSFYHLSKKYGDIFSLKLGLSYTVVISSPELAREVLRDQDLTFASRPPNVAAEILMYGTKDIAWAPYSDHWRHMRKVCVLELFTVKRIESFKNVRAEEVQDLVHRVYETCKDGKPANMQKILFDTVLNVITRMMLKRRYFGSEQMATKESEEFKELVVEIMVLLGVFNLSDFIPFIKRFDLQGYQKRMRSTHQRMDKFMTKLLQEHIDQANRLQMKDSERDFVDVMLTLPGEEKGSDRLEDSVIKAVVDEVICAGTDTSATTMEWALCQLLKHPEVLRKAHEELDQVVGRERALEESDVPKLKYIECIVKETLRLHPPGPLMVPHVPTEDAKVAGYDIPKNSRVFINIWAVHRHPSAYKNPLEFDPDRFIGSDIDVKGTNYQLLPFGTGRRICPGLTMGLIMVQLGLARLLHSFDWSMPAGQTAEHDLDMLETFGITTPKADPLQAVATARLAPHLYTSATFSV